MLDFTQLFKIIIIFLLISLNVNAKSITETLTEIESLTRNDSLTAQAQLNTILLSINNASYVEKLRWIQLSLFASAVNSDKKYLDLTMSTARNLLQKKSQLNSSWLLLFQFEKEQILREKLGLLAPLQAISQQISIHENLRLSAYFNRLLLFAYIDEAIFDLAFDTAFKNIQQWQQLKEPYLALEIAVEIIELQLISQDIEGANRTLQQAKTQAKQLNAKNTLISLNEIESRILFIQQKPHEAIKKLKYLLEKYKIKKNDVNYPSIIYELSFIYYQIGQYDQAIQYAEILLSNSDPAIENSSIAAKMLLAKSLVEIGDLTRAKKFITEAKQIFTLKNDHFGLFEVDKTNIDILYKSKDINGLYKSAKSLVNRVINFKDNQGEQRTKRANTIVQVDNQNKVIDILAKDNTKQQKELSVTKKSVQEQNTYLTLLVLFCLSLSILFIWLLFLLRKIRVLANTDVLTGITNRRHGLELAEKRLNKKTQSTLCIAIMDLDEFKSVNDTYGHDIGDKVIQLAVSQSQVALNEDDIFCRMGGEEFMYILSDIDQIKTIQRLNKIRESIFQSDTHSLGINRQISASFGATHVSDPQNKKSLTDYMIEADIALYKAKNNGRNQVQS